MSTNVDTIAITTSATESQNVHADYDAIGIGVNFDGTADSAGSYRVLVVVEAHQAGLRDRCRHRMEAIEPAGIRNELRPLCLEHLAAG